MTAVTERRQKRNGSAAGDATACAQGGASDQPTRPAYAGGGLRDPEEYIGSLTENRSSIIMVAGASGAIRYESRSVRGNAEKVR